MHFQGTRFTKLLIALTTISILACQKITETSGLSVEEDTEMVKAILKNIDNYELDMDTKMSVYDDEVVHMAQGSRAITNKADLRKVLEAEANYGKTVMTHELITINSFHDIVLTRGRVKGSWHDPDGKTIYPFETNNIITFKRKEDGTLKVWQVIFNRVALENYEM